MFKVESCNVDDESRRGRKQLVLSLRSCLTSPNQMRNVDELGFFQHFLLYSFVLLLYTYDQLFRNFRLQLFQKRDFHSKIEI